MWRRQPARCGRRGSAIHSKCLCTTPHASDSMHCGGVCKVLQESHPLLTIPRACPTPAYIDGTLVGGIMCRLEAQGGGARLYIVSLGVLAPYRSAGIGALQAQSCARVQYDCTSVQRAVLLAAGCSAACKGRPPSLIIQALSCSAARLRRVPTTTRSPPRRCTCMREMKRRRPGMPIAALACRCGGCCQIARSNVAAQDTGWDSVSTVG